MAETGALLLQYVTKIVKQAVCAGWEMPLSFTLWYAAPETITTFKSRTQMCTADHSVDLFAFGIICYELLTGMPYYPTGVTTSGAGAMLTGRALLPHESLSIEEGTAKLGTLRGYALPPLNTILSLSYKLFDN